jgi:hypothetical protein
MLQISLFDKLEVKRNGTLVELASRPVQLLFNNEGTCLAEPYQIAEPKFIFHHEYSTFALSSQGANDCFGLIQM